MKTRQQGHLRLHRRLTGAAGDCGDPAASSSSLQPAIRWLQQDRGDGGGGALVWLIVVPVVLALVFFSVQAAQVGFARSTAQAAAEAGVRAATSSPADPARAESAARDFLSGNTGGYLEGTTVTVSSTATTVTVSVTGTARALIGGDAAVVDQTASAPLEFLTGVQDAP